LEKLVKRKYGIAENGKLGRSRERERGLPVRVTGRRITRSFSRENGL